MISLFLMNDSMINFVTRLLGNILNALINRNEMPCSNARFKSVENCVKLLKH